MRSLFRKFLLVCGASAALVFAFAGGVYVFDNIANPADCGDCAPERTSAVVPAEGLERAATKQPTARPQAAANPDVRMVGVERDISAAAPRPRVAVGREPGLAPALPATPAVVDYVFGLADDAAGPADDPDTGLPGDLVRGVDAILASAPSVSPDVEADGAADEPAALIARPLAAAPAAADTTAALPTPPIPVSRPMMLLPQPRGGEQPSGSGGAAGAAAGSASGGSADAAGAATGTAGGVVNSVLGN